MNRKAYSGVLSALLLIGMLTLTFNVQSVGAIVCGDEYCWIDGDSLDVGFSKYGEMINPYESVGLRYGPVDPFANENVSINEWNEGWVMNVTYEYEGELRNVWAYSLFSDFRASGGDWIINASSPLDERPGFRGGRKTNGYAETEPMEVLYDDPELCIVLLKTTVYDWDIPNPIDPGDPRGLPLVDLFIHVVFDKTAKYVLLNEDVKLRSESEMLEKVHVKFGRRGEWDLGDEPMPWMPRSYAHFYHALPYDLVQIIDQAEEHVAYAAYWPELMSWRVESISKLYRREKLTALSDWEQDDMTIEPRTPYTFAEWAFNLSFADDGPITDQFRCATVYGISELTDGDDWDIDSGHTNMIDSEVVFDFLVNPVADFTYAPDKLFVNQEVTFSSTSFEVDGYIVSWEWDFNDDGIIDATTENATWTYTDATNYTVALTVTDNDGNTESRQKVVWVHPEHELVVSIMAPASICLSRSSLLNATVTNEGFYDEVDVEFSLFINDSTVSSATIPVLGTGYSHTLSYFWTPTMEGTYNLTVYAPAMLEEVFVENNRKTVFSLVRPWAGEVIYIRSDGSIDPPSAPILRYGDLYTLAGNIISDANGIVIERDSMTLDGAGYTVQGPGFYSSRGITFSGRNNITIKNTQITAFRDGISLDSSSNDTISENILSGNRNGVRLTSSLSNNISGNDVTDNGVPIWLDSSSNNIISGNNITENHGSIWLDSSSNNIISGNDILNNSEGIWLLYSSSENTICGNNIANNIFRGMGIHDSSNNTISGNNMTGHQWDGVLLSTNSNNNNIHENNIANNLEGIRLGPSSSNNTISGNNIANNDYGVWIWEASANEILGNNIAMNLVGIRLRESSNNCICHNNIVNNTEQVYDESWDNQWVSPSMNNTWDDGYPSGGNYWSDYEDRYPHAAEIDDSGIWNTPYVVDSDNQDNYPLMEPYSLLPRTIEEFEIEIKELGLEGEIDNQGIVTSLLAKLNSAQKLIEDGKTDQAMNLLNAFINEVQAQSGKHITQETADILVESAEYILSNL